MQCVSSIVQQTAKAFSQPGPLERYLHGGISWMSSSEEIPSDTKQGTMYSLKHRGKLHSSVVLASSYNCDLKEMN